MPDIREEICKHPLFEKVDNFIREYGILSNIMHIDIALSGGADSVCLTALLAAGVYKKYANIALRAHHIRHGLRDDARDAEIARMTAEKLSIPFIRTDLNLGKQEHNVECIARDARYGAFFAALRNIPAPALALAHHGDENAETALWRLGRGCGAEGLCMPPVRIARGARLIRPLLTCSKSEICAFLRQMGFEWAEDPTNQDTVYKRNCIRKELLPNIIQISNGSDAIYRSLLNIAQDAGAVGSFAEHYAMKHQIGERTFYISREDWIDLHLGAQCQILRHIARHIVPGGCPPQAWIADACARIRSDAQTCRRIEWNDMTIGCGRRGFCIGPRAAQPVWQPVGIGNDFPAAVNAADMGTLTLFCAVPGCEIVNTPNLAAICPPQTAHLRLAPAQNFKTIATADNRKTSMREALRSQGVAPGLRGNWPVLCDGNAPLWILGGMRSADAPKAIVGKPALFMQWIPKFGF